MADKTKILIVKFINEIHLNEIPLFRGAIIHAMDDANVLFHNHEDDEHLRYAYPLVQYKRIGGNAAIICLGEGTEAIGQFFASCQFDVCLGQRETTLMVDTIDADQHVIQTSGDMFSYRISRWLPFNSENHKAFCQMDNLTEKLDLLERLLTGNILSMGKGLGVHFEQQVVCHITDIGEPQGIFYKGVKMVGFNAEFKTNVSLPYYIGLGKGVSLGMGTLKRTRK